MLSKDLFNEGIKSVASWRSLVGSPIELSSNPLSGDILPKFRIQFFEIVVSGKVV